MPTVPAHPIRHTIRLRGYDYASAGGYFVTICTFQLECLFGVVEDGQVRLGEAGRIAVEEWQRTADLRPRVLLDEFVVMPNHLHGILILCDDRSGPGQVQEPKAPRGRAPTNDQGCTGTLRLPGSPTIEQFGRPTSDSLPTIIRMFKATTTRRINAWRSTPGAPVWHRNYYEHVIRDQRSLADIRTYIAQHPARWALDSYFGRALASP